MMDLEQTQFIPESGTVSIDYASPDIAQLAIESINKIKLELLRAPPQESLGFNNNFILLEGNVFGKLERIAALVDWKDRYGEKLGKIKQFLINHSVATVQFIVASHPTTTAQYIRCKRTEISIPSVTGAIRRYQSDEVSVNDNAQDSSDPDSSGVVELTAYNAVKDFLLAEAPVYCMKLSLLNTRLQWSKQFSKLGSLKQFLLNNDRVTDIRVDSYQGPGNDIVTLFFIEATKDAMNEFVEEELKPSPSKPLSATLSTKVSTSAKKSRPNNSNAVPVNVDPAASKSREPQPLVDTISGARVSDFFLLPSSLDRVEQSYRRSMCNQAEDVRRWCFPHNRILIDCWQYDSPFFKKLEWLGDAVLKAELSKNLFQHFSSLFDIAGLNARRQNAEQRLTLSLLFDELQLAQFVVICPPSWIADKFKAKCDILEAVVGELVMRLNDPGENGIPFGHPERDSVQRFIKVICEAALDRGAKMKSQRERTAIEEAAKKPGGGGFLIEELDRLAIQRQQQQLLVNNEKG